VAGAWGGFSNGQIPATALCPLDAAGQLLRCDAAAAWNSLSTAYQASSGSPLCITDSYRTLAAQIALRAEKPTLAAVPGTSNHGWALAVDLCEPGRGGMGFTTTTYLWLEANANLFGFTHPAWAEPGRGQEEPWHWEYTRGAS
jgi:LAS superfamily LD-carboxypeptidase LdcB